MRARRLLILAVLSMALAWPASVKEKPYRAAGDGRKDDTRAFQRALDAAAATGGGIVNVPVGRYLIGGHLAVPAGVSLLGVGRAPQSWSEKTPGSTLLAVEGAGNPDGTAFLTLQGPNATIEGLTVFYPNQAKTEKPVPYPWTVRGKGENVSVVNVLLVNPYQAVDFGTYQAPRHYVRGLYGQPLYKGIWVDQCYDIGRIQDVHFWPFWGEVKGLVDYTTTHGTTFILQRTDWEVVEDIFCWGYRTGLDLSASKYGGMNGQMTDINFDNVDVGIDISETQPWVVHISNLNVANAGAGEDHVAIWGRNGNKGAELNVRGASFWGQWNQVVRWETPGVFTLADSRIVQWRPTLPAVELLAGRAMIHDNAFANPRGRAGQAIRIGPGVEQVMVHHNQLSGHSLLNEGGNAAAVSDNQP
jgi:hypothetical protein